MLRKLKVRNNIKQIPDGSVLIRIKEGSGWYKDKVGTVFLATNYQAHDDNTSFFNIVHPDNTKRSKPIILAKDIEIIQGYKEQIEH